MEGRKRRLEALVYKSSIARESQAFSSLSRDFAFFLCAGSKRKHTHSACILVRSKGAWEYSSSRTPRQHPKHHKPPPKNKPIRTGKKHSLETQPPLQRQNNLYIKRSIQNRERTIHSLHKLIRPIPKRNKTTRRTNPQTTLKYIHTKAWGSSKCLESF